MDPPGVDPRWEAFDPFHEHLLKAYPLMYVISYYTRYRSRSNNFGSHSTLKLTKVNTYGLVYHWQGSNSALKPILMAAHQGRWVFHSYGMPSLILFHHTRCGSCGSKNCLRMEVPSLFGIL